ncbi:MAG: NAD(+)/NADH kinase [Ruminococcaceae bacterium]|nr:NAD(+)/NADH kinase [Oscillospiraceae bacterium]
MKKIFLVPNPGKDKELAVTRKAAEILSEHGAELYMLEEYASFSVPRVKICNSFPSDTDLIIVIGGDGSFIDASVYAVTSNVPMLGIDLGKVGYLSEVDPSELTMLKRIFTGDYKICEKILLSATVAENGVERHIDRLAVNDAVVSHTSYLGIADFVVYSNEGGIRYRADGVVISTPAGSTAYSLSAGGPIVSHNADAVIVTPIAPHSLFNRSVVFGADDDIRIKNTSDSALNLSIDGRLSASIAPGGKCAIRVSDKRLSVMTFKENSMFSTLFKKLKIVEDNI